MIQTWPFRRKIAVSLVTLATALSLAALFGLEMAVERAAKKNVGKTFQKSVNTLRQVAQTHLETFQTEVKLSLSDPVFRSQVSQTDDSDEEMGLGGGSSNSALKKSHDVFASADLPLFKKYPILVIVAASGKLIYTKADTKRFGHSVSNTPLIQSALGLEASSGLWEANDSKLIESGLIPSSGDNGELYLVMTQAISSGRKIIGTVLAAEPITANLLPDFARTSHSGVAIQAPSGKTVISKGSSQDYTSIEAWKQFISTEGIPSDEILRTLQTETGEHMLTFSAPFRGENEKEMGKLILFRSLEKEIDPFLDEIRFVLILILLGAIGISVGTSTYLSHKMTEPLLTLERSVHKVENGNLDVTVPVTSRDEFGSLAKAFNEMVSGLKEATLDPLTRIYNRRFLMDYLEGVYLKDANPNLSAIFFDLDHFKKINDTYGHDAGDFVLKEITKLISQKLLRDTDVLGRYGGEEFVIVLPRQDRKQAADVAERVRKGVEEFEFNHEGTVIPVTVSMGVAQGTKEIDNPHDLLKKADEVLYDAKKSGRNKVAIAV